MNRAVFFKTLRDLRWQVICYGIGLGVLAALVVYIFPSYSEQMAEFEIPEVMRGFLGEADYSSPEGFLSAEFFSFAPALLVIFAIMSGTSALGGEESSGTLELLLAQPISRRLLFLQKVGGLVASTFLVLVLTYLGWLVSVPFVEIEIGYMELASATLRILPIVALFQLISVWAAATFGRRLGTGLVTGLAVFSYFADYLANVVDALKPLQWLSVFHYHDGTNALGGTFDPLKLGVLVVLAGLFAVTALKAFEAREIGVQGGITIPLLPLWRGRRRPKPQDT